MALSPGSRLDAYEILRSLGAGGMGEVWLATELRLGRKVALKLLPADLTQDPVRVQRFEQEARAASGLSHPNVCTIYALGQTQEGQHYIAMEFVEGETLRQRLATTRLPIREALDLAIQVAAALSAAHAAGIVHRDVKPENVMLRPDGFVKVLDFGLAKLAPASPDLTGADSTRTVLKTEAGTVVGTAAYMSPEQARGQEVDARTDIWSLGVMLYEMVAGRSAHSPGRVARMCSWRFWTGKRAPLARFEPDTPSELQRIVTKALRKDRWPAVSNRARPAAGPAGTARRTTASCQHRHHSAGQRGSFQRLDRRTNAAAQTPTRDWDRRSGHRWCDCRMVVVEGGLYSTACSPFELLRLRWTAAHEAHLRPGTPDRTHVLAGWDPDRVCIRPHGQFRHLGAERGWW